MTAEKVDEVQPATNDFAATILRYMTGVGTDDDVWDALVRLANVLAEQDEPDRAKAIFARTLRLDTQHSKDFKGDEIDRAREMIAIHGMRLMANKFRHNHVRWHHAVTGMSDYIATLEDRRKMNRLRARGGSAAARDRDIDL